MPAWVIPAGDTVRAKLLAEARSVSARDFASPERDDEDLQAQAAIMALAEATISYWDRGIHLHTARGPWADQHARDRGEARQEGESDEALVARLRTPPDAVTATAIAAAADQLLAGAGIAGAVELIAVPRVAGAFAGAGASIQSFVSRGDRTWQNGRGHLVVVVPAGTPAGVAASVARAVEAKATAGSTSHVETAS